jgi:hypothetical protein
LQKRASDSDKTISTDHPKEASTHMLCVLKVKGREKSGNCIAGSDKSKKEKKE